MSNLEKQWHCPSWQPERQQPLIDGLGVSPLVAQLLLNRDIDSVEQAKIYLNPKLKHIPDPFTLPDMQKAVDRILLAIQRQEPIVIYGDYDVDGMSATSIVFLFLKHYGANVRPFLPHRDRDGYGLSVEPVKRLLETPVSVIITCDNGTSAHDAIAYAVSQGVEVIVTDHHSLPDPLPEATAIVNPMRPESAPEWRGVCGAGLAFALTMALRKAIREDGSFSQSEPNLLRYLDLASLGTVADVVPLTGVNRLFVHFGLLEIARRHRPGIAALLAVSGVGVRDDIDAQTIGFRLGPRLNAAGRIAEPLLALELLTTEDEDQARQLAQELEGLNKRRQKIEEDVLNEVVEQLAQQNAEKPNRSAYVLAKEGWHAGVIGIVASRVAELTNRPAFIIALKEKIGKGSGRSIKGVSLVDALHLCADHLSVYGGHPMAAGLTISAENLVDFRQAFEDACAEVTDSQLQPQLSIDAWLDPDDVNEDLIEEVSQLGPFGQNNRKPTFATTSLSVVERRIVGRNHLKLRFQSARFYHGAIGFRMADLESRIPEDGSVAVVHCPELNRWQGRTSVQMRLLDIKDASTVENPQ